MGKFSDEAKQLLVVVEQLAPGARCRAAYLPDDRLLHWFDGRLHLWARLVSHPLDRQIPFRSDFHGSSPLTSTANGPANTAGDSTARITASCAVALKVAWTTPFGM